jgi:antitoxin MazE
MATVATVQMWGNTRALRIPKTLAQENGLEPGTKVTITPSKAGLLIRPVVRRRRYRLADLLAQCKGRNPHREAVTGRAGREVF